MEVTLGHGFPTISGMPEGYVKIFFGVTVDNLFLTIFAPADKSSPKNGSNFCELFEAKVAIGKVNEEMTVIPVKHGHKYRAGGGWVEAPHPRGGEIKLAFTRDNKPSIFNNQEIETVFITS